MTNQEKMDKGNAKHRVIIQIVQKYLQLICCVFAIIKKLRRKRRKPTNPLNCHQKKSSFEGVDAHEMLHVKSRNLTVQSTK